MQNNSTAIFLSVLFFGLLALPAKADQAVILQYHHVSSDTPSITSISPQAFSTHLNYLAENRFSIKPLEHVIDQLRNGQPLADKTAVITFDDGYASVYEVAFPLLKQQNWPFTVFVTTDLIGSNDRLYATWDQIREMAEAGATIANHTVSHPYLLDRNESDNDILWLEKVSAEITIAENRIRAETGQTHQLLAYPYGEYNPAIQNLLIELSFVGIAQHSGPISNSSDFTALPRFALSGIYASLNSFPTKVHSLAFELEETSPVSPITNLPSPQAMLDFSNNQAGLNQITCFNNNELIATTQFDAENSRYNITTHLTNNSRRFRYNCTAPEENGRYYWHSIPWINPAIRE